MNNTFRCRIGDTIFESRDEAEAWVEAGNVGGAYSIIAQVWCNEHKDWFDATYDEQAEASICKACHQERVEEQAAAYRAQQELDSRQQAERARLAAWNSGAPIKPYVERVYLHTEEST